MAGLRRIGRSLKTRHFWTQLRLKIFKLKTIKVSVRQFFKIKTDCDTEKIDLPFAVRLFDVGNKGFQKIALENDFHTKNDRILSIFKWKRKMLQLRNDHSF